MIPAGSVLVADCGSTWTTVALIERVNGHHRLVGRGETISTYGSPWLDATLGVREATGQIERLVGRRLLSEAGELITPRARYGDGVDSFVAVSSAGAPLRLVLAGLSSSLSLASVERAAAGTYSTIAGILAIDQGPASRDLNARMQVLRQARPEVVVIAGGTDGGAVRPVISLAQLVALYNRILEPEDRPLTFFAGNSGLAYAVAEAFGVAGELRIVDNVRPKLGVENLGPVRAELEAIYRKRSLSRVPGLSALGKWAGRPIAPTTRSFGQLIRYVSRRYRLKVVGIDLGSATTSLAACTRDLFSLATHADLGMGLSAETALKRIPLERVVRWLPFIMDEADAHAILLDKSLHPSSVPETWEELLLEYALAREVMRQAVAQARPGWLRGGHHPLADTPQWDLMLGAGRTLTRAPHPGYAALLLIDALEPVGVSQLALDSGGIAASLGAVADAHALVAAEVVEQDAFLNLGTVVAPLGTAQPGEMALHVKVYFADGRVIEQGVAYGSLSLIALAPRERARLELHPTRRFDVGLGEPGRGVTAEAEGGILGLIIDARGRPLRLPADDGERSKLVQAWLESVGIV